VRVRGAREHNLKNVDVDIPDSLLVFPGSLRLRKIIPGLQDAVRPRPSVGVWSRYRLMPGACSTRWRCRRSTRSSVGSVTRSRICCECCTPGREIIRGANPAYAESFSPNTPEGACPNCHGIGRIHDVSERSLVPDDKLNIRERPVAVWPTAWQVQPAGHPGNRWL